MSKDAIRSMGEMPEPPSLALPGASVSALAVDADGTVRAATTPDRALLPASNTKLVTAALALDVLGPDHRLETTVHGDGAIENRTLAGDLVLRGSGAPDLDTTDLTTLAGAVEDVVDRVAGNLVVDTSQFAGPRFGPGRTWQDARHAYGAPTSAVVLARNTLTIHVSGGGIGSFDVTVEPETRAVNVVVDVTADEDADPSALEAVAVPCDGTVQVRGRAPPDAELTAEAPVIDPERHGGLAFQAALAAASVTIDGTVQVRYETDWTSGGETTPLGAVESAAIGDLVRSMNVDSDNVIADQLARVIAGAVVGEGSWTTWRTLVAEQFAELGVEAVDIRDGSGLSRYNRVSARGLVALLEWATESDWADVFFESLPAPGEGTLSSRLDGVAVRAKTGTLTGTRALSGRLRRESGSVLFSVLQSGLTVDADAARERQDEWVRWLARR